MNQQPQLFVTKTDRELAIEREIAVDKQILAVMRGPCMYPVTDRQRDLVEHLRFRYGQKNAVQIGFLAEQLKTTPRQIKEDIADLTVRFRLPIGSSRDSERGGYYLAMTYADRVAAATPHLHQARAHLARVRALLDEHEMNDLMGQLSFEKI